jgi:hypothetical protein
MRRRKQPLATKLGRQRIIEGARTIEIVGAETDVAELSHGIFSLAAWRRFVGTNSPALP